jgi:hypothetical protein
MGSLQLYPNAGARRKNCIKVLPKKQSMLAGIDA